MADLSPEGLAALFRQPNVTLPGGEAAKATLRALQQRGVTGLDALLGEDQGARRQAIEDAIFGEQEADVNRNADVLRRDIRENLFARNVGTSSIGPDYYEGPLEGERLRALASARRNAVTQSGQEVRADQNQQLTALGQAFNEGTAGLQGEANVESANRTANQAATQAGATAGIQEGQFSRELGSREALQREAFTNAQTIASGNQLSAGIASGLGGLANLFAPTINATLLRQFGF